MAHASNDASLALVKGMPDCEKVGAMSRPKWVRALHKAGLKRTAARIAVLEQLDAADAPMTHKDLGERLAHLGYERATLYRILMDFVNAGLVTREAFGHWWRFELVRGERRDHRSAHPHFFCNECGDIACLPDGVVRLVAIRGAPRAIQRRDVEVQLKGRCDTCSARQPEARIDASGG
jgi:Fur family ferric uptake transcriptional regulator